MSFEKHEKNGIVYFTSTLFDSCSIPHFFAARRGGVSSSDHWSLNFSTSRKNRNGEADSLENVRENLRRVLNITGGGAEQCAMMRQIHSAGVAQARISCAEVFDGKGDFQPCDGIFAHRGDRIDTLCVKTADCVPILLYDTDNDIACAVHAGWRGTVADIAGCAVREMREHARTLGGKKDGRVVAAIGARIMPCCYEVNDKVYEAAFVGTDRSGIERKLVEECFPHRYFAEGENKYRIDLAALSRLYLVSAGVDESDIDVSDLCTCCHEDEAGSVFFSHRASGGFSGTQLSGVSLKK